MEMVVWWSWDLPLACRTDEGDSKKMKEARIPIFPREDRLVWDKILFGSFSVKVSCVRLVISANDSNFWRQVKNA